LSEKSPCDVTSLLILKYWESFSFEQFFWYFARRRPVGRLSWVSPHIIPLDFFSIWFLLIQDHFSSCFKEMGVFGATTVIEMRNTVASDLIGGSSWYLVTIPRPAHHVRATVRWDPYKINLGFLFSVNTEQRTYTTAQARPDNIRQVENCIPQLRLLSVSSLFLQVCGHIQRQTTTICEIASLQGHSQGNRDIRVCFADAFKHKLC